MYHSDIQGKIEMLPENAKQELSDFAEFLLNKYYMPLNKPLSKSENKRKRYLFLNDDIWEGEIPSDLSGNHERLSLRRRTMTGKSVFIDTGAYLAYFCKRDRHHSMAYELWNRLEDKQNQTVTTNHIIDEVATLLARRISYEFSADKLKKIYDSEYPVIIRPNRQDEKDAIRLFEKYADQKISFTDCLSFVVMKNMKIRQVFSFDRHFGIMGFKVNTF